MNRTTGLGKGLGALLNIDDADNKNILELNINNVEPDNSQPRKSFNDESMKSLADSIKQHGIVQPIIVRKEKDSYRIIAGERRWRAARIAGLAKIPAIVKNVSGRQQMELALIENLQREDLNPIEEAQAFNRLIKEYGMKQEEISVAVGKSRSAIANSIRLLSLDEDIKERIKINDITSGHARAVLSIEDKADRKKAVDEIINGSLNVRQAEALAEKYNKRKEIIKKEKTYVVKDEQMVQIEDRFKNIFGTKVKLISGKDKGKILIEYYSDEELDRIITLVESINK
jgi:ParB family transcriptional regulator, chromosome partitioning protein